MSMCKVSADEQGRGGSVSLGRGEGGAALWQ